LSILCLLMRRRSGRLSIAGHAVQMPAAGVPAQAELIGAVAARSAPRAARRTATLVGSPFATRDPEFLPAALEILVAPPSPVAMWLMALISFTVLSALAWSYFGWLDIHAVAAGKIQPSGHSKIVQPLDPGKVVAIHVENGARVAAGDVLLELDPTETAADRDTQARELESTSAEAARRRAAVASAEAGTFQHGTIEFAASIGPSVREREQSALGADLAQLSSNLDSLRAQIDEKIATKDRLKASIAARERLIALYRERVAMRENIETAGAGSRALVIEALQQLESQITTDVGERGQLTEADAAIRSLQRKLEQSVSQFVAEQIQKRVEAERKRDRLEQELIKAKSRSDHTLLRAPLDGTIQQLAVTTVGQVVTTGQSLMTIVPIEAPLEVEAMIANRDIGFVKTGQRAVVKVEAFPFTRYGVIEAEVVKVSRDAVDDRDAAAMTDAPATSRVPTASRPQNLFYAATLRLTHRNMTIDGEQVPLAPGMAVTVEIKTGERRALDYILSPVREMVLQSAHER
jgi:hemolysin D